MYSIAYENNVPAIKRKQVQKQLIVTTWRND